MSGRIDFTANGLSNTVTSIPIAMLFLPQLPKHVHNDTLDEIQDFAPLAVDVQSRPAQRGTWRHHAKTEARPGRLTSAFSTLKKMGGFPMDERHLRFGIRIGGMPATRSTISHHLWSCSCSFPGIEIGY